MYCNVTFHSVNCSMAAHPRAMIAVISARSTARLMNLYNLPRHMPGTVKSNRMQLPGLLPLWSIEIIAEAAAGPTDGLTLDIT